MAYSSNPVPYNYNAVYGSGFASSSERDRQVRSFNEQMTDMLKFGVPSVAIGAVDTITQSVTPESLVDDETITRFISNFSTPLGRHYGEHKEGFQTAGELGTFFFPMFGAMKAMRVGSWLHKAASKTKLGQEYGNWVFASGKTRKDFVDQLDAEMLVYRQQKQLSVDMLAPGGVGKAIQSAKLEAGADALKEAAAANASIIALYNNSDMVWNDDLSTLTNVGLFLLPDIAFAGLASRFTGTAIKRHLQARHGEAYATEMELFGEAVNTQSLSLPGGRGPEMSLHAAKIKSAEDDLASESSALRESATQRKNAEMQLLQEQALLMGKDDVFGHGISHRIEFKPDDGEIKNLVRAAIDDPSLPVSVRGLEKLKPDSQVQVPSRIESRITALDNEINELLADIKLAESGVVVEKLDDKVARLDKLQAEKKEIKDIAPTVLEKDQSITPLQDRRYSILDDQDEIDRSLKIVNDAGEDIYTFKKSAFIDSDAEIGITKHGKLLITPLENADKKVLGGINLTTVLSKTAATIRAEKETMKLNIRDISQYWHFERDKGKAVFDALPDDIQREIKNWVGSSNSSQLRKWFADNDPRAATLMQAYREAGLHRRLHELADDDGTITLWRGESAAESKNPTNDVVSMAATPEVAQGFAHGGKNLVKRRVPVEDVIMVVGGLGDEAEFIVKGNLNRNKMAFGVESTDALSAQSWDDRMKTFALAQKMVDNYKPADGPIFIHGESNWLELDIAYQIMQKFPDEDIIRFAGSGMSNTAKRNQLEWRLVTAKAIEWQKLKAAEEAGKKGLLKLKPHQKLSDYDRAKMLNLPNPTPGGLQHPMIQSFNELLPNMGGEIRDLRNFFNGIDEFRAHMAKNVNEGKLGEELINDHKFSGSALMHNHDPSIKPALLLANNDKIGRRFKQEEMAMFITANKLAQNALIDAVRRNPQAARDFPVHHAIYNELLSRPEDLKLASRPDQIIEGLAKNKGIFGQQSETFSDTPVIQAMDRLKDLADKAALQQIKRIFEGPDQQFRKAFNTILSNQNSASLDTFNMAVNSLQHGWRLKAEPVQLADGQWAFALDDSWEFNKKQYKNLFGRDFDEILEREGEVLMPIRAGFDKSVDELPKPAVVDGKALDVLKAVEAIDHKFLDELNLDRELRGLTPISKKPWHIPPVNLANQKVIWLADATGAVKGMVVRPTEQEALRVAQQEVERASKNGELLHRVSDPTLRQYHETMGEFWQDPKNFSWAEFQTGSSKGKLGTSTIQFGKGPLNTILEQQQRNYEMLVRNTFGTMFESELNHARSRIIADTLGDPDARAVKAKSMQAYERVVLGKSALNTHTMIGRAYRTTETLFDEFLRKAWDKYHSMKQPTAQSLSSDFERIDDTLGAYNPFRNSLELLEANENVRIPPTTRKMLTKFNSFTTDMVLRIFDLGMPIINFASLVSVQPSVLKALQRGADETYDMWKRRIGIIGSPVDEQFVVPKPSSLFAEGIQAFFDPDMQRIRKLAAERGYTKQEVAERVNLWTSPHQGWTTRNRDEVIRKLSWPTDKSEVLSREIAFGMMFRVGRKVMKLGEEEAMLFAHTQANKIIGDFRPTNRPQMFQGAAGMPLGLFTTWAMNWLQRVFGDFEAGRMGAVFYQAAVQQFMFGANSMPGVQSFVEEFTASYDGKTNMRDALESRYGVAFTDWLMDGTLATMTNINFASRADVSLPAIFSGEDPVRAIPPLSVANQLTQGTLELISSLKQQGFNADAIAEIISVRGVNGALKNLAQFYVGHSVDQYGNTIERDVRTWENIAPRLMELKGLRETKKMREMQRDRMQRQIQRQHIDRLSKQLRTAVRGNKVDNELLNQVLHDYVKAGGSPTDLRRYIRGQVLSAGFERSTRLLLEALRQNDEQGKAMRLIRYTEGDSAL